ncbi:MAG: hypothetical protein Q9M23_01495, partial [Mariprofundaceae bacterium]|nr:hypothetical protein [Mariprofundaceae bacterium]
HGRTVLTNQSAGNKEKRRSACFAASFSGGPIPKNDFFYDCLPEYICISCQDYVIKLNAY